MSLSIRTNVASINAQRNLSQTQSALESSMSHLSSGMRITKASDDAAGLGISVNLEAQIRSYNQAARNANDGVSVVQTAEGALNEVTNILSRLRELTMQAASDTVGTSSVDPGRASIISEAKDLSGELDRIDATAEFNNTTLFGAASMSFQVGIRGTSNDHISVDLSTTRVDQTNLGVKVGSGQAVDLDTSSAAQTSLDAIDAALDTVSGYRATLGSAGNRFQSAVNSIQSSVENLSAADSRIRDVDVAAETANLSRAQILSQAGISVLAQANQMPQMALKLLG